MPQTPRPMQPASGDRTRAALAAGDEAGRHRREHPDEAELFRRR